MTDAQDNTHTDYRRIGPSDFGKEIKTGEPVWSIEKTTLHGGKQEGCELVIVDNGVLEIVVIPTRGMSILQVTRKKRPEDAQKQPIALKWDSPVKEVVHPQHIRLESRGGLGWLEGFNEWMVRCGLESAGHPGKDPFINNVGESVEMDLTLHGKIGNIPASRVAVTVDSHLRVQGVVHERMFYGPKLELITEVATRPGSLSFTITDKLVNHGASEQEYQLIYHTNFGSPLLEEGAKAYVTAEKIAPMNAHAAKSIDSYADYGPPTQGFIEQVYLAYPKADPSGWVHAMIRNRQGDRGVSISWKKEQLPYFTLWKNTAAVDDGYVTGLEPGTGFPYNRNLERSSGRVPKIGPKDSRLFELEYAIHETKEEVSRFEEKIRTIQGTAPQRMAEPPIRSQP